MLATLLALLSAQALFPVPDVPISPDHYYYIDTTCQMSLDGQRMSGRCLVSQRGGEAGVVLPNHACSIDITNGEASMTGYRGWCRFGDDLALGRVSKRGNCMVGQGFQLCVAPSTRRIDLRARAS